MSDLDFLQRRFPHLTGSARMLACEMAQLVLDRRSPSQPYVLGISGAQGSGKSTLAELVSAVLEECHGLRLAVLSLDDFYLPRAERELLGRSVHPLCATRGVAGTHDMGLLAATLDRFAAAGPDSRTAVPVFDKLADDRLPDAQWSRYAGRVDCVILEGWCVGLRAAHVGAWSGPANALEAEEDADGTWAKWSAAHLPAYEAVWDRIDYLLGIVLPDMETVIQSRLKQERGLVAAGGDPARAMDEAGVRRFVGHYERHTRALWAHFRDAADRLVLRDAAFEYQPFAGS